MSWFWTLFKRDQTSTVKSRTFPSLGDYDGTTLVSATTAARLLGLSPETVRRMCRNGRIPGAVQPSGREGHWKIPLESIEDLLT